MIKNLKIENFIIVKKLNLEFERGLQVLSGETGAGKSIIVGAIDLVLGGSLQPGMLFDENKPAYVEVVFDIDESNKSFLQMLHEYEVDLAEGEVFIAREIGTNLRSKSFINGRRVSQEIIAEFRPILLDFHSQRDQQKLFNQEYQLEVLDIYGNLLPERANFEKDYKELETNIRDLRRLEKQEKEQTDRIKLFAYQVQEIEAMQLKDGEDEELQAELNLLSNAEAILNQSSSMEQDIYENENSVHDIINSYISQFSRFEDDNPLIKESVSLLQEAVVNLDDAVSRIREIQNVIDLDGSRMENLQDRMDAINSLSSKYRRSITEILTFMQEMKTEIETFSSQKDRIIQLQKEIEQKNRELKKQANELTAKRKKAAQNFEKELILNIKKLAIPDAQIEVIFSNLIAQNNTNELLKGISITGQDEIDYYFSANKGIKIQPLRIAASGGELSRFLLTIKKILANRLDSRTIIFDEIDSGIGGKTSELLAEFIHNIGDSHQVICITHLPQIAAYADKHFAIVKKSGAKTSEVDVYMLTEKERLNEIARMLSGSESELAVRHADELLKKVKGV
ncbi:MAG: DNA repair protein RecN [Candidatus Cloacimonadales bacterium]|nr:DNA repair protein RecN [Candidatus Cloacimonadales bacterium]